MLLNFAVLPLGDHQKWFNIQELILPPDLQDKFSRAESNLPNNTPFEGIFEGTSYIDIIETCTGYSLETPYLTPEEVQDLYKSLQENIQTGLFFQEDLQIHQLTKFFCVCAQNGLGLVNYFQENF